MNLFHTEIARKNLIKEHEMQDIAQALYTAARDIELDKVDEIIQRHGVNFDNGRPFSLAVMYKDLSAVKLLLKKGADFTCKDRMVSLKNFF